VAADFRQIPAVTFMSDYKMMMGQINHDPPHQQVPVSCHLQRSGLNQGARESPILHCWLQMPVAFRDGPVVAVIASQPENHVRNSLRHRRKPVTV